MLCVNSLSLSLSLFLSLSLCLSVYVCVCVSLSLFKEHVGVSNCCCKLEVLSLMAKGSILIIALAGTRMRQKYQALYHLNQVQRPTWFDLLYGRSAENNKVWQGLDKSLDVKGPTVRKSWMVIACRSRYVVTFGHGLLKATSHIVSIKPMLNPYLPYLWISLDCCCIAFSFM